MGKTAVAVLGFALLVLLGAIAIPSAIESKDDTVIEAAQIDTGETAFFNDQIEISVIDSSQTETTIRVTDTETGDTENATIEESAETTFNFQAGDITVRNDVSNNQGATLTVEYPAIYGFSPAARTIGDNLAIILISAFFISIMAFVGVKQ